MLNNNPCFRSPFSAFVIKPIAVGPVVQPISPESARNANIIVVPPFNLFVLRLNVAGHIADIARPHNAQPIRAITGLGDRLVNRYEIMQSIADAII